MNTTEQVERWQRLQSLLDELIARTEAGRIAWKKSDRAGRYVFAGRAGGVAVFGPPPSSSVVLQAAGRSGLEVLDQAGARVDGVNVDIMRSGSEDTMLFSRVQRLFELVSREDHAASKVTSDLLDEIRAL